MDILQPRLLSANPVTRRTALQYAEQMLDLFTNSALVTTVFHFFVGLPSLRRPDASSSSGPYSGKAGRPSDVSAAGRPRLSLALRDGRVSIGIKPRSRARPAVGDSTRFDSAARGSSADTLAKQAEEDESVLGFGSPGLDLTRSDAGSLLGAFNMRMRKINLEHANMNTRLALRGPGPRDSQETHSVTSSQAFAVAADRNREQKVGNLIALCDSVLRRNKEDDEDDVLFGDYAEDEGGSEDIFAAHPELLKELRVDYSYNRDEHEHL